MVQRGDKLVVTGTDYLGTATVLGGVVNDVGKDLWHMFVSLEALESTRLGAMATLYERYHIDKFTITINGGQATTATEQFICWYDADPSDLNPAGDTALHAAMATTNSGVFKAWESATLTIPPHRMDKGLYTNRGNDLDAGTSTDQRLFAAGRVGITAVSPFTPAANYTIGSLWVSYQVTFDIPQLQRDVPASSVYQSETSVPVSATIQTVGTRDLLASAVSAAGTTAQTVVAEMTSERHAEGKADPSASWRTILPAGKYVYDLVMHTTNSLYQSIAALSTSTGNSTEVGTVTVAGVPTQGTGDPLGTQVPGRLAAMGATTPSYIETCKGYFELVKAAAVSLQTTGMGLFVGEPTNVAKKLLLTVLFTSVASNMRKGTTNYFQPTTARPPIQANGGVELRRAQKVLPDGRIMYGQFPADTVLDDGWAWSDNARPSAAAKVVKSYQPAAAAAAEDWTDEADDCRDDAASAASAASVVSVQRAGPPRPAVAGRAR